MTPRPTIELIVPNAALATWFETGATEDRLLLEVKPDSVATPDDGREHPAYSMGFVEVSVLVATYVGGAASLVTLGEKLWDLYQKVRDREEANESGEKSEPVVVIDGQEIPLSEYLQGIKRESGARKPDC